MSFCGSNQGGSSSQNNQWIDPLGPTSISAGGTGKYDPTGAPQMRSGLFDYIKGITPQLQQYGQQAGAAATGAANNPLWGAAATQAGKNISGDYLAGSPQLDAAMNQNTATALRGASDQNARTASNYALNGLNYSTAHDQAAQAATGAAVAGANNTNAQTYLQNYQSERANQNNGANQLGTALGAPLSYLNQASTAQLAPSSQIGNILSALSSGGQTVNGGGTSYMGDNPSIGSDIMNGASVLGNF